jgi:hypothetical protein
VAAGPCVPVDHVPGRAARRRFTAGDSRLPPVTVDATGCQQVTGVGPVRWTTLWPAFWSVLAIATGIAPADQEPFRGTP